MNTKKETLKIGEMSIEVLFKDIKNIHLSVHPPKGRVRVASPLRYDLETLRVYIISKLSWIRKQQSKILAQDRETPREYLSRETHYYLGKRYLLKVIPASKPRIVLNHSTIEMFTNENESQSKKKSLLNEWYRIKLREIAPEYIRKWEKKLNVKVEEYGIRSMKTRWGTCTPKKSKIWLNLELAKKPLECVEYIIAHEMMHLIEPSHNSKFVALMDKHLPKWELYKEKLNSFPLSHTGWEY